MLARHDEARMMAACDAYVGNVIEPEANLRHYQRVSRVFHHNAIPIDSLEILD